jgi:hypothetical protein
MYFAERAGVLVALGMFDVEKSQRLRASWPSGYRRRRSCTPTSARRGKAAAAVPCLGLASEQQLQQRPEDRRTALKPPRVVLHLDEPAAKRDGRSPLQ